MEPMESDRIQVVHERIPSDNYVTPPEIGRWTIDRCALLQSRYNNDWGSYKPLMLEPGCGDTSPFSRYAGHIGMNAFGVDIRDVDETNGVAKVKGVDFLKIEEGTAVIYNQRYDIIATNPPFIYGIEFINRSLDLLKDTGVAAFNMKMSFLGTRGRYPFFRERTPSEVHILSKRPSYAHKGTDRGQEYCVLIWHGKIAAEKHIKKYGRVALTFWHDNKGWVAPVYGDGNSRKIIEKD